MLESLSDEESLELLKLPPIVFMLRMKRAFEGAGIEFHVSDEWIELHLIDLFFKGAFDGCENKG